MHAPAFSAARDTKASALTASKALPRWQALKASPCCSPSVSSSWSFSGNCSSGSRLGNSLWLYEIQRSKHVMQIELHHLNKVYRGGVHALNDLDLKIGR